MVNFSRKASIHNDALLQKIRNLTFQKGLEKNIIFRHSQFKNYVNPEKCFFHINNIIPELFHPFITYNIEIYISYTL